MVEGGYGASVGRVASVSRSTLHGTESEKKRDVSFQKKETRRIIVVVKLPNFFLPF